MGIEPPDLEGIYNERLEQLKQGEMENEQTIHINYTFVEKKEGPEDKNNTIQN